MLSRNIFEQLKCLKGLWRGSSPAGREYLVEYDVIADGTVIIERWQMATDVSAATLYHLDGQRLMATHYCPAGNQPRLVLRHSDELMQQVFHFDFVDATNLTNLSEYHQHHFDLEIFSTTSFIRGETYRANGKEEYERTSYRRS